MLPRLSTTHLALMAAIAETGVVGAAAARLGLTQSAASHRLREAERRVGRALVVRRSTGVTLTPEGERLAAFAARFLGELARLEREIEGPTDRRVARFGQATYSRYHWLPAFLDHVAETDPGLSLDLYGGATARPLASLLEGAVDVSAVYARPGASQRFAWHHLGRDPIVAVMAPGHRLAAEPYLASEHLIDERLYLYPFAQEPGFEWEALLGPPTAPFRNIAMMATPEAVIDLVRAGFGTSFFSRWAIEPELAAGALVAVPLGAEGMALDWWAVTRAGEDETTPAGRLVRALLSWQRPAISGFEVLAFDR